MLQECEQEPYLPVQPGLPLEIMGHRTAYLAQWHRAHIEGIRSRQKREGNQCGGKQLQERCPVSLPVEAERWWEGEKPAFSCCREPHRTFFYNCPSIPISPAVWAPYKRTGGSPLSAALCVASQTLSQSLNLKWLLTQLPPINQAHSTWFPKHCGSIFLFFFFRVNTFY